MSAIIFETALYARPAKEPKEWKYVYVRCAIKDVELNGQRNNLYILYRIC